MKVRKEEGFVLAVSFVVTCSRTWWRTAYKNIQVGLAVVRYYVLTLHHIRNVPNFIHAVEHFTRIDLSSFVTNILQLKTKMAYKCAIFSWPVLFLKFNFSLRHFLLTKFRWHHYRTHLLFAITSPIKIRYRLATIVLMNFCALPSQIL